MAIIEISTEEAQRPYLMGGEYGSGLTHEADVELWKFEYPAVERTCPFTKERAWKDEDPENRHHAYFGITVVTPNGDKHYLDIWKRGSQLKKTLLQCGVVPTSLPGGGFQFDSEDVAPRKLGGVRMGDPREFEGEMRNGFVNAILSR